MEESARFFKASILETQVLEFDGTTLPIKRVPNWRLTGGKNNEVYSHYASGALIPLMKYDPVMLRDESKSEDDIVNARITYSVV